MVSSDKNRNRKERILSANRIMLQLDDRDFQGTVRFSYKSGEGVLTYVVEEHGNFATTVNRQMAKESLLRNA